MQRGTDQPGAAAGRVAAALRRRAAGRGAGAPLLTVHDGPSRVELSATTASLWAAKVAGLLEDLGVGVGDAVAVVPGRSWTSWVALLGALEAGADVEVLDRPPAEGSGHECLLVDEALAPARLAGVEVVALGHHPLSGRCTSSAPGVLDLAAEAAVMPDDHPAPARDGRLLGAAAERALDGARSIAGGTGPGPVVAVTGRHGALAGAALLTVDGARVVWSTGDEPLDPGVADQERVDRSWPEGAS